MKIKSRTIIKVAITKVDYDNTNFYKNGCNTNNNILITPKILHITFDIQKRIEFFENLDRFKVAH